MEFKVIEGVHEISSFHFMRTDTLKKTMFIIASVATLGLFALILFWFEDLRYKCYKRTDNPQKASKVFFITDKGQKIYCDVKHKKQKLFREDTIQERLFLKIGLYSYYYTDADNKFYLVGKAFLKDLELKLPVRKNYLKEYQPHNDNDVKDFRELYGENKICLKQINIFLHIGKTLIQPLNVYEIFLVICCMSFKIYLWGVQLCIYILVQIIVIVLGERDKINNINDLAGASGKVEVIRKSNDSIKRLIEVSDENIVVGDIIKIKEGQRICCDLLILSGTCLVNQAVLSGESIPVTKSEINPSKQKITDKNILFSGSDCLILQAPIVWGLVIGTSWSTLKGSLIGDIVIPKNKKFKFDQDFISICFALVIIYTIINLILVVHDYKTNIFTWRLTIIRFIIVISSALPPSLFFAFVITIHIIRRRLKRKNVRCLIGEKLKETGRVGIIAFDKTGTLTEDSIKVCGFMLKENNKNTFAEFNDQTAQALASKDYREIIEAMATCNNLHIINENIVGDPIDVQMFNQTNFKLRKGNLFGTTGSVQMFENGGRLNSDHLLSNQEGYGSDTNKKSTNQIRDSKASKKAQFQTLLYPDIPILTERQRKKFETFFYPPRDFVRLYHLDHAQSYKVHSVFDFTPERKRLSVIIERPLGANLVSSSSLQKESQNEYVLFCKGAPEIIKSLCNPNTIPENYDEKLIEFSEKGFRVIALAYKSINENQIESSEEILEANLNFIGLVFMVNPLKEATPRIISELKDNRIECLMITGDNIYTAVNVGLGSGIIQDSAKIFIGSKRGGEVEWTFFTESSNFKNLQHHGGAAESHHSHQVSYVSQTNFVDQKNIMQSFRTKNYVTDIESILKLCEMQNCCLALEGDAFDFIIQKHGHDNEFISNLVKNTAIYGRTNPEQKQRVVNLLKDLNEPKAIMIGFVGDGSNDCKALHAANMGLSIGSNDSSIAASFSTNITDISPVIPLLIEGRFTLENLVQIFKVSIFGGLIDAFALIYICIILQFPTSYDNFTTILYYLPLYLIISSSQASEKLNPFRPKAGFFNRQTMGSFLTAGILSLFYITFIFYILVSRPEYKPVNAMISDWANIDYDAHFFIETKYLLLAFIINYITIVFTFHRGYPFKKSVFRNYLFLLYYVFIMAINIVPFFIDSFDNYEVERLVNRYERNPNTHNDLKPKMFMFIIAFTFMTVLIVLFLDTYFFKQKVEKISNQRRKVPKLDVVNK